MVCSDCRQKSYGQFHMFHRFWFPCCYWYALMFQLSLVLLSALLLLFFWLLPFRPWGPGCRYSLCCCCRPNCCFTFCYCCFHFSGVPLSLVSLLLLAPCHIVGAPAFAGVCADVNVSAVRFYCCWRIRRIKWNVNFFFKLLWRNASQKYFRIFQFSLWFLFYFQSTDKTSSWLHRFYLGGKGVRWELWLNCVKMFRIPSLPKNYLKDLDHFLGKPEAARSGGVAGIVACLAKVLQ